MKILVTGADGFVGKRLIEKLSKEHSVSAFSLFDKKIPGAKEVIVGDVIKDLSGLDRKRFDVIYHLAAVLDESNPDLWTVNVEGTRNMLELCKNRKFERFISLGPIGVLGETKEPSREDFPYNPSTDYERSKVEAERIIMDYKLKHQIPYTTMRSTIIYGPNTFWKQILSAVKKGYPLIGKGENYFHLVYIDDVIDALLLALDVNAKNQIYNIAGPDTHTYKETYEIMSELLGVDMTERSIHPVVAKARALTHEASSKVQGKSPKVTLMRSSIERLLRNRIVNIEKARKELGFKPKFSLREGMRKTINELGF
ncbi:NAD(P)-dependent oxidoreductase [archaeon]|nr:NAD(P)-dependent oxidoreductase [archaeon]